MSISHFYPFVILARGGRSDDTSSATPARFRCRLGVSVTRMGAGWLDVKAL